MYIYLIGKPCSGKDTIARFISAEYGFKHIIAGKLVGDYILNTYGPDSNEMKKYNEGYIIKDHVIAHDLIKPIIDKNGEENLLFDGFPRTEAQFESHMLIIKKSVKKLFIMLDISDEEAIRRMEKRVVCSVCSKSQIVSDSNQCQFCMSESLYRRLDDYKESMLNRLEEFTKKTKYVFNIKSNKDLNLVIRFVNVTNMNIQQVLQEIDIIVQKEC